MHQERESKAHVTILVCWKTNCIRELTVHCWLPCCPEARATYVSSVESGFYAVRNSYSIE